MSMPSVKDVFKSIKRNQQNIRFLDLCKICDYYFGSPRQSGSSHRVYKTPWIGDPWSEYSECQRKSKGVSSETGN